MKRHSVLTRGSYWISSISVEDALLIKEIKKLLDKKLLDGETGISPKCYELSLVEIEKDKLCLSVQTRTAHKTSELEKHYQDIFGEDAVSLKQGPLICTRYCVLSEYAKKVFYKEKEMDPSFDALCLDERLYKGVFKSEEQLVEDDVIIGYDDVESRELYGDYVLECCIPVAQLQDLSFALGEYIGIVTDDMCYSKIPRL